jgi:hypothetical protein
MTATRPLNRFSRFSMPMMLAVDQGSIPSARSLGSAQQLSPAAAVIVLPRLDFSEKSTVNESRPRGMSSGAARPAYSPALTTAYPSMPLMVSCQSARVPFGRYAATAPAWSEYLGSMRHGDSWVVTNVWPSACQPS